MPQQCTEQHQERRTKELILSKIPAFPPVVLKAMDLLATDRTRISELADVITSDATLSAQVLRMANSALFSFTTAIETVQHGVVVLGLARVQALIMTVAATNYMRAASRSEAMTKCWRHTLACAIVSRELACASGQEPDRAYTVGLLHDIGRLGLLVGYPAEYREILAEAGRDAVSLLDLEKRRFGMDHCEAGRLLMGQWGLPEGVLVAAGRHHDPPQGGPFDMLQTVYFACRLADTLGYFVAAPLKPATFEELTAMLPEEVRERFCGEEDALRRIVEGSIGEGEVGGEPAETGAPAKSSQDFAGDAESEAEHDAALVDPETAWSAFEGKQLAWVLLIVAASVAVFVALMLGLKYLGKA
jgi:HD-like signal output (HDOD) protein